MATQATNLREMQMETHSLDQFMRLDAIKATVGAATSTIYKWIKEGRFPRPIKVGNVSVWSAREIADWQAAQIAERDRAA